MYRFIYIVINRYPMLSPPILFSIYSWPSIPPAPLCLQHGPQLRNDLRVAAGEDGQHQHLDVGQLRRGGEVLQAVAEDALRRPESTVGARATLMIGR